MPLDIRHVDSNKDRSLAIDVLNVKGVFTLWAEAGLLPEWSGSLYNIGYFEEIYEKASF